MKIKKNGKVIKLTESDLQRIVKRVLNEQPSDYDGGDYYGTFDGIDKYHRSNEMGDFEDYEDYDGEEFNTWDEYQESGYPNDPENHWSINSRRKERGSKLGANDREEGKRWFDEYQKKSGGKPFTVRHKRRRNS